MKHVIDTIKGRVIVVLLVIVYLSIRVVQQYEKMVVFRLGRTNEGLVRGPGLRFLIPIIDRPIKVDLRETFVEVPSQTTITKDNAPVNIDFLIYWYIVDPLRSLVNVQNFAGALQGIATTTLRAVIGDILLDDVLSKRDQINEVLRAKLDEQTERWGGKVTTVEIREIIPPRDVQEAVNRMLSAERNRRAVITESEMKANKAGTGSYLQLTFEIIEGPYKGRIFWARLNLDSPSATAVQIARGEPTADRRVIVPCHVRDLLTRNAQFGGYLKAICFEIFGKTFGFGAEAVHISSRICATHSAGICYLA